MPVVHQNISKPLNITFDFIFIKDNCFVCSNLTNIIVFMAPGSFKTVVIEILLMALKRLICSFSV